MSGTDHLLADSPPTISKLEISEVFKTLKPEEKLYAHHISRAAVLGSRITLRQVSPESETIFDLIIAIHKAVDGNYKKVAEKTGISEEDVKYWVEYAASILGNLGNYKSFGDQKFIPRISRDALEKLSGVCESASELFSTVADAIYSTEPSSTTLLGYPDEGHVSSYYPDSPDITKDEINAVQKICVENGVYVEHTRLKKVSDKEFILLIASITKEPKEGTKTEYKLPNGGTLKLQYGDYSDELKNIAEESKKASETALTDLEKTMWQQYVESWEEGSLEAHREAQKTWVKDTGPVVETNIGFIETYRDPRGVRAEWEGFAAVVNKEQTEKFGELVRRAGDFIPRLPWSKEFEKDKFLKPDFTSLEVLTFAGSGIPAGINIPNYDDIRQNLGFKNVSLGNVLSAKAPNEKTTFIREEDLELYDKLRGAAFEVQVGIHELLGHGTGKLLQETSPGQFNFDPNHPPFNPVTKRPVDTWYKPGETWGGVFKSIAASYEECRAECVAMYLCAQAEILKIFGYTDTTNIKAEDVLFVSYLQMARAGLLALEYWDPKYRKWGQGHMQARFSILQTFLKAGNDFCTFQHTKDDYSDLTIVINRDKIKSVGVPAVGDYLLKLHVYKSTADKNGGEKLYDEMTSVSEEMAKYREVVMAKRLPRKQFVMANTVINDKGEVELKEYEATPEGMIQSYVDRDV